MKYATGQIVKTVYGELQIVKANKNSVLVSDGLGGTIKVNVRQLDIMN